MKWHQRLLVSVAVFFLAAVPALGQTAQDTLKVVPEKAAGFVIFNNLAELNTKIEALAKRLGVPLPFTLLEKIKGEMGIDKGLNTKGSLLLVALMPRGEDLRPIPLLYVPVTDYQEFLQEMHAKAEGDITTIEVAKGKQKMIVGQKGSFAVLTTPAFTEALKDALKNVAGAEALAPLKHRLTENDVTGVLTTRGIKLLVEKARDGLAKGKNGVQLPPEAQFLLGWLDAADGFLKSVESDVTHLVVGSRLDSAGNLDLNSGALFAQGSGFAQAGAKASPDGAPLAGLPNIPYLFAFSGPLAGELMGEMMNFGMKIMSAMAKDVPAEKVKRLEQIAGETVKGMRSLAMVVGVGKGKESLFHNTSAVLKVKDAQAYLKNYKEYLDAYSDMIKDVKLPGFANQSFQSKRTKVAGLPALEVTVDFGGGENQNELLNKIMEVYFGPGGKLVMTTVAVDENTLLMRYKPAAEIKDLKASRDGPGGLDRNKEIAKTIPLLPKGAQWVVFISPRGNMEFVNRIMAALMPPEAGGMRLPEFPSTPPVGLAVKFSAAGLESRLVVPAAVLDSVGPYIQQLKALKGAVGAGF